MKIIRTAIVGAVVAGIAKAIRDRRALARSERAAARSMDALQLLQKQHQDVDELIALIETTPKHGRKALLFFELADAVAAHAAIEEHVFYPAVMAAQTKELLLESVEEHLSIKRLLADLLELDPSEDEFDAKLAVMKEQLSRHAHEDEEARLFPKVRALLDAATLESLGHEMEAVYAELLEGAPRLDVPDQIGAAAEL